MHHASQYASHTEHGKVLLRHVNAELLHVPNAREEESRKATDEQRGCECSATSATTVCCRCGKHLGEEHHAYVGHQQAAVAVEQ